MKHVKSFLGLLGLLGFLSLNPMNSTNSINPLSPTSAFAATGCSYPGTLDTWIDTSESPAWQVRASTEDPGNRMVSLNRVLCAIEKIQAELGVLPKGTYATVVLRLNDAVYLVGTQTIGGTKIFSGSIELQSDLKISGDISPAQIVANQNDYDPTGLSTVTTLRLTADAARSITGLAGGADGRILMIHNVGSFNITLADEDSGSSASNRFALDAGYLLKPDRTIFLQYDATSLRWRCLSCRQVDLSNALEVVGTLPDANLPASMAGKTLSGTTIISERLDLSGDISPAQITAATNNYDPTGLSTATTLRLTTDATRTITGLAGGADGRILVLHNVGAFNLILSDEDASSTAGNRFALSANLTLTPDQSAVLHYDATSSRWRLFGGSGSGGGAGAPGGAAGDVQVNDGAGGFTAESAFNYSLADNQLKLPGVNIDEDFALTGDLTPAQLVADANDYSPAGLATASVLRVSGDASRAITGLGTGTDGRVIYLHNVGAFNITLVSQSGLSIAANRFAFSANITIAPEDAAIVQYDPTASRWRLVSGQPGPAGSAPGGASGDCQFNNGSGGFTGEAPCNYDSALNQLTVPGLNVDEDLALRGDISPAQIVADTNDYAPTGFATAAVLRVSTDASRNLTGLAGGTDGRLIGLVNIGSFNLVLVNESASSSAANRFAVGANQTIGANEGLTLLYDATSSRWRSIGKIAAAGASGITSLGSQTGATQTITRGAGIGGSSAANDHSFTTASGEADFLASGALTCGAGTQGKAQVHTTPLQYCDNAATPALHYSAYGDSSGNAMSGDSATSFFGSGTIEDARLPASRPLLTSANNSTIPASETLVGRATTDTLTNKLIDCEAAGNDCIIPHTIPLDLVGVSAGVAGHIWNDDPLSTTCTAAAITGTNRTTGVCTFPDSDGDFGKAITLDLPTGWNSGSSFDADIWWKTTGTGNARFQFQTKCYADDETDDAAFNAASIVTAAAGTSGRPNKQTITGITTTGCAAGEMMRVRFFRNRTEASDTLTAALDVEKVIFKIRVTH